MATKRCRHDVIFKKEGIDRLQCEFCKKVWLQTNSKYANQETYFSSKYKAGK